MILKIHFANKDIDVDIQKQDLQLHNLQDHNHNDIYVIYNRSYIGLYILQIKKDISTVIKANYYLYEFDNNVLSHLLINGTFAYREYGFWIIKKGKLCINT